MYQTRDYRHWVSAGDLISYTVKIKESDLYIRTSTNLEHVAREILFNHRKALSEYIRSHPFFASSFEPVDIENNAPAIVKLMYKTSKQVGVGPMASVAGAISQMVGEELSFLSKETIIENGGDIYINSDTERIVAIYAGASPLSGKFALRLKPDDMPAGVCTSSGTVGHSISFGKADAVVALSSSAALADAAATGIGNMVLSEDDIPSALKFSETIKGLTGTVIIKDKKIGFQGKFEVCAVNSP